MTVLYKTAGIQLSKQPHYDFGLHSQKSVLKMAGKMKRDSLELSEVKTITHFLISQLWVNKLLVLFGLFLQKCIIFFVTDLIQSLYFNRNHLRLKHKSCQSMQLS